MSDAELPSIGTVDESIIEQTCKTLQRYYISLHQKYEEGKFAKWCEDYGLDKELLMEEAKQDAEESMLVDFDNDTPFPLSDANDLDELKRKDKILNIINKCIHYPDIIWPGESDLPVLNSSLFELTEEDVNRAKQEYHTQCPVLWNKDMFSGLTSLHILAVGLRENFSYLLLLDDDYNKQRIEKMIDSDAKDEEIEDWTVPKWSRPDNHYHFKMLRDVTVNVLRQPTKEDPDQTKYITMDYKELAKMAVVSFNRHGLGTLQFNGITQIDDSIKKFFEYLLLATEFITNLINHTKKEQNALCPFMMDVLLAVGAPKYIDMHITSLDKETEADRWIDCIGSVKARLDAQNLNYVTSRIDDTFDADSLHKLFKQFVNDHNLKGGKEFDYPYCKRFILLIDRRRPSDKNIEARKQDALDLCDGTLFSGYFRGIGQYLDQEIPFEIQQIIIMYHKIYTMENVEPLDGKSTKRPEKDMLYIYEPPPGPITRDIPDNFVPEWGISASYTCWLPNKNSDESRVITPIDWRRRLMEREEQARNVNDNTDEKRGNIYDRDWENSNLNASFYAKGGIITLSFHVYQPDVIKCYLHWKAQRIRLFPEYMDEIVSRLYTQSEENKKFMTSEYGRKLIERIKRKLIDRQFKAFVDSYKNYSGRRFW